MSKATAEKVRVIVGEGVSEGAASYTQARVASALRHHPEPPVFARVRLHRAAVGEPRLFTAQANLLFEARPIRSQVAGPTLDATVELLGRRLRSQFEALQRWHEGRWQPRLVAGGRRAVLERRRHQPAVVAAGRRPRVVRRKRLPLARMAVERALFEMEMLDYDFMLFVEPSAGRDAFVRIADDGTYEWAQVRESAPVNPDLRLRSLDAPLPMTAQAAVGRLAAAGARSLFFMSPATGRGNVVYRRFDGELGLLAPE